MHPPLQALPSGNYSFQIKAIDAAGNLGEATNNYRFSVNSRLRPAGQAGSKFWGLGWKFWLIVGIGGAVVVGTITTLAILTTLWLRRRRPESYAPQENVVVRTLLNQFSQFQLHELNQLSRFKLQKRPRVVHQYCSICGLQCEIKTITAAPWRLVTCLLPFQRL